MSTSVSEPLPTAPARPASLDAEALRIGHKLREVGRALDARYLDKAELVRLLLVTLVAGEHMLIVGPPGTAKSALVRHLARLIDARYFEYLLTRFSEPNEIFGPIDIKAFREGTYLRRVEAMLPDADIVFLDEIFKSNSAILNALLSILNERRFFTGAAQHQGAAVVALRRHERGPQRRRAERGVRSLPGARLFGEPGQLPFSRPHRARPARPRSRRCRRRPSPAVRAADHAGRASARCRRRLAQQLQFPEEFLARYKALCFQIRSEGVTLSDRRVVKLLKLFAASALVDGRPVVDDGDFFVLRHIWNSVDQIALCDDIVAPVLERHRQEHPEARPAGARARDLDGILVELGAIRGLLLGGAPLSDVQLFSQLRNLQEIRAALQTIGTDTAQAMAGEVDKLLEGVFESSKWTG